MANMLSIIIPVYNVETYLDKCLESVTQQGLDNFEVILVNDSSTDESQKICEKWCERFSQLHLINSPKNEGLSSARNRGIHEAKGEYITFVDSDDFLAENTLYNALINIGEAEVLEYPVHVNHYSSDAYDWVPKDMNLDFKTWMLNRGHEHCYAWNKIYKKSLWDDIEFPPNRYFEDIFTIPEVLQKAHQIKQTAHGFYFYCSRKGSICDIASNNALRDYALALNYLLSLEVNIHNTVLYIRARNAELTYQRVSGKKEHLVNRRNIPLKHLLFCNLTRHERLKGLWYKFTRN